MLRKKVLVAANAGVRDVFSNALFPSGAEITFCASVEEAESLLGKSRYDLILCTLQFDGSRWADLLRRAKANPASRNVPFLMLKITQGVLSDTIIESSLKAAKLIGADDTVNLPAWRRESGDEQAYQMLRNLISELW
jgi:CheY-like chemotaxis protein